MMTVREAFALGFAREAAGRFDEARALYEQILAAIPGHPGALFKLGEAEHREGRLEQACSLLERAAGAAREQRLPSADIWLALGRVHVARRDWSSARIAFASAREAGSKSPEIFRMLAWLALEQGEVEHARSICDAGLDTHSGDAELIHLKAKAQRAAGELDAAYATLRAALDNISANAGILVTLAAVCIDLGRAPEARLHLTRAIELGENAATTWDNLGLAHLQMGELDHAAAAFERAVTLDPKLTPALSNWLNTLRHACRWEEAERREREWLAALGDSRRDARWNPFLAIALDTTPAQQLVIARRWSQQLLPNVAKAPAVIRSRGVRLRIGYLSSDFRQHPMSLLMARHLELHDRRRFEVVAYSHGPIDDSAIRKRVQAGVDHWVEARALCDAAIAQKIREDGIDVLVELNGHTQGDRLGVLAARPATVQLHYLGFPATLGYEAIDGTVADAIVAPPAEDGHFSERVLRMPRCYFVTDGERVPPSPQSRVALGFAESDCVLASFNQTYKLTRRFVDIWLDTLKQVPNAVLWLYMPSAIARANVVAHAARAGIDPSRIAFADKVPQDAHLARLACADLALDVLPCSSHTTGVDALWMGVPMLSCRGTTFAGRVGESLLRAVELPELIADSIDVYRQQLLALASDRERLHHYKSHLQRERRRLPLFDTQGFTRDFETLVCHAYEEIAAGRS